MPKTQITCLLGNAIDVTQCHFATLLHCYTSNSLDPLKTAEGTVGAPTCYLSNSNRTFFAVLTIIFVIRSFREMSQNHNPVRKSLD
jgi:hypothetical protein